MPGCRAEYAVSWGKEFLSTPSARRATKRLEGLTSIQKISIHALREESDIEALEQRLAENKFLSTPSVRRATQELVRHSASSRYFYPRPPRGGRRGGVQPDRRPRRISIHALRKEGDRRYGHRHQAAQDISIHALREEGDFALSRRTMSHFEISIHALREEGDQHFRVFPAKQSTFLSTPSARRATARTLPPFLPAKHFYPRPPRGGRPVEFVGRKITPDISIHALREEGDAGVFSQIVDLGVFLSTPSVRRAT